MIAVDEKLTKLTNYDVPCLEGNSKQGVVFCGTPCTLFAASEDPNYKELAKRLHIAKSFDEYEDLIRKVNSTGQYADIGYFPWFLNWDNRDHEIKFWYQSSETIGGDYPYILHLANKKWPLLKVC